MNKIRKVIIVVLIIALSSSLCGCGINAKKVDEMISEVGVNIPSQSIYDDIVNKYNELSDSQKESVSQSSFITKFEGMDLDLLIKISEKLVNINTDTRFADVLAINEEINNLSPSEKAILDTSIIDEVMSLSDTEKAVVAAVQYVQKSLKSPKSLSLLSANAIDDTNGDTHYYLVKLSYTATNSFGGEVSGDSFQTINSKFENPWWGFAILNGDYESVLNCTPFISFYLTHTQDPISFDCDKIMYYVEQ